MKHPVFDVHRIFDGSNGAATRGLYAHLETLGPAGVLALNLFRAVKCSGRAKSYGKRDHIDETYRRKHWSMENICTVLTLNDVALGVTWGWQRDPRQPVHCWILYVELPNGLGQCSFHTGTRITPNDFPGKWDGRIGGSTTAMLRYVQAVLNHTHLPITNDIEPNINELITSTPV